MNRKSKAGFTLIELMVVAIIVAILAAVAIPLMTAQKKKAYATEAQAGCSAIRTALRVMEANGDTFPAPGAVSGGNVKGISGNDLDGTYFDTDNYLLAGGSGGTNYQNYIITATASKNGASGTLIMTNLTGAAGFGGTLWE